MLYMYEKRKNPREDSKGEELLLVFLLLLLLVLCLFYRTIYGRYRE